MAHRAVAERQTYCQVCGLSRDKLTTRKVRRESDGHELMLALCGGCDKALRDQEEMTRR